MSAPGGYPTPDFAVLLPQAGAASVVHLPEVGAGPIASAAQSLGYPCAEIDLAQVHDKEGLLTALGQGLAFPPWFGHNWDALEDCLTDMSWWRANGYVLILRHADLLHAKAEGDFFTALRILADVSTTWGEEGIPFWTFVELTAGGCPDSPRARMTPAASAKRPFSVLVVIHTPSLSFLLMERIAPAGFWQSVTGSLEAGETWIETAQREMEEETGLRVDPAALVDLNLANRYPIPAAFIARYPLGVSHNHERVFSYQVSEAFTPRLARWEHSRCLWLPAEEALARASSWTNRDAIRLLAHSGDLAASSTRRARHSGQ